MYNAVSMLCGSFFTSVSMLRITAGCDIVNGSPKPTTSSGCDRCISLPPLCSRRCVSRRLSPWPRPPEERCGSAYGGPGRPTTGPGSCTRHALGERGRDRTDRSPACRLICLAGCTAWRVAVCYMLIHPALQRKPRRTARSSETAQDIRWSFLEPCLSITSADLPFSSCLATLVGS